jgi:hypothetical protein
VTGEFGRLYSDLADRAAQYGVRVGARTLPPETPAVFDGPTVTLDPGYDLESRSYYLAHAVGSIAQWAVDHDRSRAVFGELRAAKAARQKDPARFERAVAEHQAFEERSSGHAVWLLTDLGHAWAIPSYTVFFRADLAAIAEFHRTGTAPVWCDFYPEWKRRAARGEVEVRPFDPRPVSAFRPVPIPKQEVVREEDGEP